MLETRIPQTTAFQRIKEKQFNNLQQLYLDKRQFGVNFVFRPHPHIPTPNHPHHQKLVSKLEQTDLSAATSICKEIPNLFWFASVAARTAIVQIGGPFSWAPCNPQDEEQLGAAHPAKQKGGSADSPRKIKETNDECNELLKGEAESESTRGWGANKCTVQLSLYDVPAHGVRP